MSTRFPLPPLELAARVGGRHANNYEQYEEIGARMRDEIVAALPVDWSFEGKTLLDFGCGAGRTLRHFGDIAERATVLGCDIDGPSIDWLQEELSPPFSAFVTSDVPPLPLDDGSVDLVWAISVFSHLTDHWSDWLAELHRVLADDGLLFATFIGRGASSWVTDEPWVDDEIGMNVLHYGQGWEIGGPMVLHSTWWLRAHWGRGFDMLSLREAGFATDGDGGQGVAVMRRRSGPLTAKELSRVELSEPREVSALLRQVSRLRNETSEWRAEAARLGAELDASRLEVAGRDDSLGTRSQSPFSGTLGRLFRRR